MTFSLVVGLTNGCNLPAGKVFLSTGGVFVDRFPTYLSIRISPSSVRLIDCIGCRLSDPFNSAVGGMQTRGSDPLARSGLSSLTDVLSVVAV
jgi:hypothetical protein